MKIPFDIKYRPQIEAGEYKVETRDGRPAKVVSFEMTDTNDCPVAAQFRLCAGTPVVYLFDRDGRYKGEEPSNYDLFIVTPEEELSEFEARLIAFVLQCNGEFVVAREEATKWSKELLALARKELEPEVLKRLEEAYKNQDEVVYDNGKRDGKAEALKDLPRWKPAAACYEGDRLPRIDWLSKRLVAKFEEGIFYLDINDLYKLPGFKEDESHE